MIKYLTVAAFTATAATLLGAPAANAHVTFENTEAVQDTTIRMVARVPHGCGEQATLRLRIQIPDGVVGAQPMPKAGWELTTETGTLSKPYTSHGSEITEGVTEIIWEGELPSAFYDEFIFRARFTDQLPADEMVYIPVVQECADGAERWIEIPAEGQSSDDLDYPAPGLMLLPAAE